MGTLSTNLRRIIILVVVVAVIAAGMWLVALRKASSASTDRDTVVVEKVDFPVMVTATGILEATKSVSIGPPQIRREHRFRLSRMVEEGTEVTEGDFVLEFDNSDVARRMREQTANLQRVGEEYQKKRSDFDIQTREMKLTVEQARADLGKLENKLTYEAEFESAATVEETRIRRDAAKKKLEFLEQKLKHFTESGQLDLQISRSNENHYRSNLDDLMTAMEALTVRAPVDGVVIYKRDWNNEPRQIGSYVFSLDTVLEIPDLDTVRAKLFVDEVDAGKIRTNQETSIIVDALQGRSFIGVVNGISSIFKQATFDRPQKVAETFVQLKESGIRELRPGMSVKAQIQVGWYPQALVIPLSAIQERGGLSFVQIWNAAGQTWDWREVTLRTHDGFNAVVQSGVSAKDRIRARPKA